MCLSLLFEVDESSLPPKEEAMRAFKNSGTELHTNYMSFMSSLLNKTEARWGAVLKNVGTSDRIQSSILTSQQPVWQ
jgi:hypothetical protein